MKDKKYNLREFKLLKKELPKFLNDTPLWYYILLEARTLGETKKLGPLGSKIVSEVIIGLLVSDKSSYLNQKPDWKPIKFFDKSKQKCVRAGTMENLFKLADIFHGLIPNQKKKDQSN